jgi:hypothetical protein
MEFLLLWADNLDDAVHALRHAIPKILSLIFAVSLFALTGFALMRSPHITLAAIGLVLSASLVEAIRRRRVQAQPDRRQQSARF